MKPCSKRADSSRSARFLRRAEQLSRSIAELSGRKYAVINDHLIIGARNQNNLSAAVLDTPGRFVHTLKWAELNDDPVLEPSSVCESPKRDVMLDQTSAQTPLRTFPIVPIDRGRIQMGVVGHAALSQTPLFFQIAVTGQQGAITLDDPEGDDDGQIRMIGIGGVSIGPGGPIQGLLLTDATAGIPSTTYPDDLPNRLRGWYYGNSNMPMGSGGPWVCMRTYGEVGNSWQNLIMVRCATLASIVAAKYQQAIEFWAGYDGVMSNMVGLEGAMNRIAVTSMGDKYVGAVMVYKRPAQDFIEAPGIGPVLARRAQKTWLVFVVRNFAAGEREADNDRVNLMKIEDVYLWPFEADLDHPMLERDFKDFFYGGDIDPTTRQWVATGSAQIAAKDNTVEVRCIGYMNRTVIVLDDEDTQYAGGLTRAQFALDLQLDLATGQFTSTVSNVDIDYGLHGVGASFTGGLTDYVTENRACLMFQEVQGGPLVRGPAISTLVDHHWQECRMVVYNGVTHTPDGLLCVRVTLQADRADRTEQWSNWAYQDQCTASGDVFRWDITLGEQQYTLYSTTEGPTPGPQISGEVEPRKLSGYYESAQRPPQYIGGGRFHIAGYTRRLGTGVVKAVLEVSPSGVTVAYPDDVAQFRTNPITTCYQVERPPQTEDGEPQPARYIKHDGLGIFSLYYGDTEIARSERVPPEQRVDTYYVGTQSCNPARAVYGRTEQLL